MEALGIERYVPYVGEEMVTAVFQAARPLYGLRLLHVNSTFHGGGVAGMLHSLIPLMNDVGINADWSLLYGDPSLFQVTKKLHNALQGEPVELTDHEVADYLRVNEAFARYSPLADHNIIIVHDPQPLPMIRYQLRVNPWVWRCHIDISTPHDPVWEALKPFILRYDGVVVSSEAFRKPDLPVDTHIIAPAIDPLSELNRELTAGELAKKLDQYGIPNDKPILVQVSRFDKWKDPLGVVEVFRLVKAEVDCRLVLIGSMATDDPEGPQIFSQVQEQVQEMGDVHLITQADALLVNALQQSAAVVMQLSRREGFGLTVSEALWKETPVVATNVGGIPQQVIHGQTGYLVEPGDYEGAASLVTRLLQDPELRHRIGSQGREHVRQNFLMPRLLLDWLRVLVELA
ncbi:MAG TPA: glycosyltransferase [Candidatus Bipolaricaulis sp.]|nr:glycosyltransferase [Candidatus Bipolaricaulis sp.]HRS13457.1 glycosyltransferase [Candidatus Bipolaricaulis sp.]HRU22113.1 glycosyltransferase [Candidatus Bipolaricaulis sp.]